MGSSNSKHGGQVISKTSHNSRQPQEPPYAGPSAEYQFVNVNVQMTQHMTFSFSQSHMTSSNVDTYYPFLNEQYAKGFRLLSFYHIPGQVTMAGGLFSGAVNMPFQGIFCRYPNVPPGSQQYQLHIEKSVIQPQMVWSGFLSTRAQTMTNTDHLVQTIANTAARGGRLLCIELTGHSNQQHSFGRPLALQVLGCDLFFEMPIQPPQDTYVYNVVSEPIRVTISGGFMPRPVVQANWLGVLQANLGQGWRLVEIFMDESQSSQVRGFRAETQLNSQWYFEKPASRMHDPTPVYQGTVVEHQIVIRQQGFSGTRTQANWEPIMQDMGNKGWELACLLETPDQKVSGLTSVTMKVLLFFQRKMVPDQVHAHPGPQPPFSAAAGAPMPQGPQPPFPAAAGAPMPQDPQPPFPNTAGAPMPPGPYPTQPPPYKDLGYSPQ